MLNSYPINSVPNNYNDINTNTQYKEVISSFGIEKISKYVLKTPLGQYFNIWNFWKYESGICWVWNKIRYGNILLDTNIENLTSKDINYSENTILNWGKINGTRFTEKEIEFTIKILSDTRENLEKEIQNLKKNVNLSGLKIIKQEKNRESEIVVELQDIEVWKMSLRWTEVTLYFISLDPNFKTISWNTKSYKGISWNLSVSLVVNDTDIAPFLYTLIDLKQVSETITSIELEVNGYTVSVDTNISSPEKIIFNGKQWKIFIWDIEMEDFSGKFIPFPINKPLPVEVRLIWGTSSQYNVYFSYDNIYL